MPRGRLRSALLDIATAGAAVVAATGLSFFSARVIGPKYPLYPFLFLLAIMAAAARGYLPGIFTCLLTFFVLPYFFNPHFKPSGVDPTRFIMTVLVSVLISAVLAARRRAEKTLRRSNEELDQRVSERTGALEAANRELARREEELSSTKTHLNDVLDSVQESFLALDRQWRFTYVNKRILDNLGAQQGDVVGKVIWDVFPAAVETEFYPQYHKVMEERVAVHFEVEYRSSGRWFEVAAHPTREGLSAYVADVTDRKRDEAALGRLATIVESCADAIISKDLDGTILTWNSGAARIYGFPADDAVGKSMQILLPEDRLAEEKEIQDRLRRGEQVEHFETVRVRKDRSPINVSLTISPIRNREGQVVGASHIARDITDQLIFDAQIRQVQKLESLGVLAGGIAHDFNNLLVGVLGNASLALDSAPPGNRELLQEIVKAGQRAADLTSQLLAYAGKGRFYVQLVDVSALVREISSLIQTSISSSVNLRLELADDLPPIEADSGQIQQVVMNLVINAAEAIPENAPGEVSVRTRVVNMDSDSLSLNLGAHDLQPGRFVALEVLDTGTGMDEETRARIFDPFFTTKFTGRGLGLSAVLGIVGSHNGALTVDSEPGRGTTFRILLPVAEGAPVGPKFQKLADDLTGTGKVLIVDDEEIVRKVAKTALERFGYSVVEASDGLAAVDIFTERKAQFSVIVLDLKMPNMGGEEALARLREIRRDVPVILSSGFSETEALRRFEGKGVAGFVQKPYTAIQLAEKVKAALGSGA